MHARSTHIRGNQANLEAGIDYVRNEVLPAVERTEGCVGLSMLTDGESGRCIVATAWADEEAMRASAEEARTLRHQLVHTLGGEHADAQEWEIAVLHRDNPAGDGAGAQVTWARIAANHIDDLLDAYRSNLMPKLQELPGFCSVSMLVDRRNARTVSVTSFESREAAVLIRKHAGPFASSSPRSSAPRSWTSPSWTSPSPTCGSPRRSDERQPFIERTASAAPP